ncbi:MAG: zinc-dependent alcohol dehydrogenase family protein [Acidobacteria bacterium]|nr:zinc-dependent alcohol dehydrogenase family protein [Acidobacteriota bacterium]
MKAMVLETPGRPLVERDLPKPGIGPSQVLLRVLACAVCRTDLHILDGELPEARLPLVPGHQIVGTVAGRGPGVTRLRPGDRVGVPWLAWTCNRCGYCRSSRENLCDRARFTGYHRDGGYAEYAAADERYCFPIPPNYSDVQAAPLLCAGLIGFRSLRMTGQARRVGFYGFGSAAHLLVQAALHQGRQVYAFTRSGDRASQEFALRSGAVWAGESGEEPPAPLEAAIIFAPAGELVPAALKAVAKGGSVICAGIHMSDIPAFPYSILWGERAVRSVANLTRRDGEEFLELASRVTLATHVNPFALSDANQALSALRSGTIQGTAVLVVD